MTKVHYTLVEEPAWKTPFKRSRNRWYGSAMMDVKEAGSEDEIGFIWRKIKMSGGLLERHNKCLGSIKCD